MARIDAARGDHEAAKGQISEARGMFEPKPEPPPPEPPKAGLLDRLSGVGHAALDVAGFIPGLGIAADLVHAGWYAAEGDYVNAGLLAAAAIPVVGDTAAAIRLGARDVDAAAGIAKNVDNATDAARAAGSGGGSGIVNHGGRFADLDRAKLPGEVGHHMPQNAYNRDVTGISRADGPALGMTVQDHAKTRTFGGSGLGTINRERGLSPREVLTRDISDIRQNFGAKYERGIAEMMDYVEALPQFREP